MHSLLICGGSILHASFFFECKEVGVASSHLVSCLASILVGVSTSALISSLASVLAKSDRISTKLRYINIWMYSSSQYKNLHPFYSLRCTIHAFYLSKNIYVSRHVLVYRYIHFWSNGSQVFWNSGSTQKKFKLAQLV